MLKYIKNKKKIIATLIASGLIINHLPVEAFANEISILNEYFKEQLEEQVNDDIQENISQSNIETNTTSNSKSTVARSSIDDYNKMISNIQHDIKLSLIDSINKTYKDEGSNIKLDSVEDLKIKEDQITGQITYDGSVHLLKVKSLTSTLLKEEGELDIIRYCKNMEQLNLTFDIKPSSTGSTVNFSIEDLLNAIVSLTNLRELHLTSFGITDNDIINAGQGSGLFSNLNKLEKLGLRGNSIKSLNSLASCAKSIITLDLSNQKDGGLSNLDNASRFTKLKTLDISRNSVTTLNSLSELKNLETIDLSNNQVYDLTPVANVKNVSAEEQTIVIKKEIPLTKGNMPGIASTEEYNVEGAFVKNITKHKDGKNATIQFDHESTQIVKDATGAERKDTSKDYKDGNNIKWRASDLGFTSNSKTTSSATVQYRFDRDGFSGTVINTIVKNKAPKLEVEANLRVVVGASNGTVTINSGQDVINELVNIDGISVSDEEYNDYLTSKQEGNENEYLSFIETKEPTIKYIKSTGKTAIAIYPPKEGETVLSNIEKAVKETNGSTLDLEYVANDDFGNTTEGTIKLQIIKSTKPEVVTKANAQCLLNEDLVDDYNFKYTDENSKKEISELDGFSFDSTFVITPEDINNLNSNQKSSLFKSNNSIDKNQLIQLLIDKKALEISDKDENFNSRTGFANGNIELKLSLVVEDGKYLNSYKPKDNIEPSTAGKDKFNVYKATLQITDSNGDKSDSLNFMIMVTNKNPKIDIDSSADEYLYGMATKVNLFEDIEVYDFEDTKDTSELLESIVDNPESKLKLTNIEISDESGKTVSKASNSSNVFTSIFKSIINAKTSSSSIYDEYKDFDLSKLNEPGDYNVSFKVEDSDGNTCMNNKIIRIQSPENPLVILKDTNTTTVNPDQLAEIFTDPVKFVKELEKQGIIRITYNKTKPNNSIASVEVKCYRGNEEVSVDSNGLINGQYAKNGEMYYLSVKATDKYNKTGESSQRIALTVESNYPVSQGISDKQTDKNEVTKDFLLEGVKVEDTEEGNITKNLKVTIKDVGELDSKMELDDGVYEVIYTLTDKHGNYMDNNPNGVVKELTVGKGNTGAHQIFFPTVDKLLEGDSLVIGIGVAKTDYSIDKLKEIGENAELVAAPGYKFKELQIIEKTTNGDEKKESLNTSGNVGSEIVHEVTFVYANKDGKEKSRTIKIVVTNKAPEITLKEGTSELIDSPANIEKGVLANDQEDGNLTDSMTYKIFDKQGQEMSDISKIPKGNYRVVYTVKDSDGNETTKTRLLSLDEDYTGNTTSGTAGDGTGNNGTGNNNGTTTDTNKPSTDTTKPGTDSNSQNNQDNQNGQDGQNGTSQNGTGDHPNTIFKDMYDLTGERSLSLSEAKEFKKNPLADVQIVENDMGITIEDIEVLGLEEFNPEQDLTGEERVKDYLITYKVKGYNKVATENINVFSLLMGNVSLRNSVLVAENTLEMEVQRKVTVSNEKPEILGSEKATVEKSKPIDALAGVEAKDAEDGDLTSKVTVSPDPASLDTSKVGEVYTLSYTVQDSDGNFPNEPLVRTFEVVEATSDGSQSQNGTQNGTQSGTQNGANGTTDPNAQGKPSNPQTGDSSLLGVSALAVLSGLGLLVLNRKKD